MSLKRMVVFICALLVCIPALIGLAGCSHSDDGVDAPLMKNAPPPPPRPNTPTLTPNAGGGGGGGAKGAAGGA